MTPYPDPFLMFLARYLAAIDRARTPAQRRAFNLRMAASDKAHRERWLLAARKEVL